MTAWRRPEDNPGPPAAADPPPSVPPQPEPDAEGELHNVFGGEIPEPERAWRRLEEFTDDPAAAIHALRSSVEALPEAVRALRAEVRTTMEAARASMGSPGDAASTLPDTLRHTLEALPGTLEELRAEIRSAGKAAREAMENVALAGPATGDGPASAAAVNAIAGLRAELQKTRDRVAAFDAVGLATALAALQKEVREAAVRQPPLDAAGLGITLRQLREEIRESATRSTDVLAATRTAADAVPSLMTTVQDELARLTSDLKESLAASNAEAARAFSLVAREVRALGDRQAVLREEVRLLGKRLEEMERFRRRQGGPRPQSQSRVPAPPPQSD